MLYNRPMIYVIYASQSKMVKDAAKRILDKEIPDRDPMNSVSLDMGTTKLVQLYDEASYIPLGYDKKAVVAENFYYLTKTKTKAKIMKDDELDGLLSYFRNPMEEVVVFLLVYSDEIDTKGEIFKALEAGNAKFMSVAPFTDDKWAEFIPHYFEKRDFFIDYQAAALLQDRIGGDYSLFINEAEKLMTYCDNGKITYDVVDKMVAKPLEDNAYILSNALCSGDIALALSVYKDLRVGSVEPIVLLRLLGNQFRFLNQVAYLYNEGYSIDGIMNETKQKYGRIKASISNIRAIGTKTIAKTLEDLYQAELDIFTGKIDQDLAMELLIANFGA